MVRTLLGLRARHQKEERQHRKTQHRPISTSQNKGMNRVIKGLREVERSRKNDSAYTCSAPMNRSEKLLSFNGSSFFPSFPFFFPPSFPFFFALAPSKKKPRSCCCLSPVLLVVVGDTGLARRDEDLCVFPSPWFFSPSLPSRRCSRFLCDRTPPPRAAPPTYSFPRFLSFPPPPTLRV
jgi:hypothetical protein